MEAIIIYVLLSFLATIFATSMFMTKPGKGSSLESRLIFDLMFEKKIARNIQFTCDWWRIGDRLVTDLVIYDCAYQGKVTLSDFHQIQEHFPGMIHNPGIFHERCIAGLVTFDEFLEEIGVKNNG